MTAEGKAIIFHRCNLLFFYFVNIDERPAMGSPPNLASRSEVRGVDLQMPTKISGASPQIWGAKNQIFSLFSATSALDTAYLRNEA